LGAEAQLAVLRVIDSLPGRSWPLSLNRGTTGGVWNASRIGVIQPPRLGQTLVSRERTQGWGLAPWCGTPKDRPVPSNKTPPAVFGHTAQERNPTGQSVTSQQAALNRSRLRVQDAAQPADPGALNRSFRARRTRVRSRVRSACRYSPRRPLWPRAYRACGPSGSRGDAASPL
jgi:hypothetical protein